MKTKNRPKGLKYNIKKINPTWVRRGQRLSPKTEFKKGQQPYNFGKGKGYINIHGYKIISINGTEILEHRYIISKKINRKLKPKEHTHHINENRLDNRIENLKIMERGQHTKLHHKLRRQKKWQ